MTSTRRPIAVPETLIARARRGDQASFDAMFAAYQPFLLRHLRMVCGTKADDVAAATWESVAGSLDRFRGDGHDFRRWLFTIARRRLVDDLRRDARRPLEAVSLDSVAEPAVAPDTSIEGADWISQQLRTLPTRQAEVISLRVVGGLPVRDVAELLGISEANVRVLGHRGLAPLRAALIGDSEDADRVREEIGLAL